MLKLPEHLSHKPVFAMPYEAFDGIYAGATDAKYLSIGLAQYQVPHNAVSAKVWRHPGERWSRNSEELPLHRVVDLTLFLATSLFGAENPTFQIPAATFDNQDAPLTITRDKNRDEFELERFNDFLAEHGGQLKARLNALTDTLLELRQKGKL